MLPIDLLLYSGCSGCSFFVPLFGLFVSICLGYTDCELPKSFKDDLPLKVRTPETSKPTRKLTPNFLPSLRVHEPLKSIERSLTYQDFNQPIISLINYHIFFNFKVPYS